MTQTDSQTFLITFALLIFMKIVCFILGFLTIRLGYRLIANGAKGEFKFSANLGGVKADLASVSPGLLFVTLGVLLIGYAIFVEKPVTMTSQTRIQSENMQESEEPRNFVIPDQDSMQKKVEEKNDK